MTAETPTPDAPETDAPTPDTPQESEKPRSEVPAEVAAALKKANKEAETLRRQLKEYEDRDKTEAEKLAERASEAEGRALAAEKALLRKDVALIKGLPADLVDRLRGETAEELSADADALLALLTPAEPPEPAPLDLGQGNRGSAALPLNGDPLLKAVRKTLGI